MYILNSTEGRGVPNEKTLTVSNMKELINAWKTEESVSPTLRAESATFAFLCKEVLGVENGE